MEGRSRSRPLLLALALALAVLALPGLWPPAIAQQKARFEIVHEHGLGAVALSPDGARIVTGSAD